jgi:hypothetical protein
MGVERFHLGYGGAGNATFTNINVSAVAAPSFTTVTSPIYLDSGNILLQVADVPTSTHYGARVGGEEATFVVRSVDSFVFSLSDDINALTANDPADDPDVSGHLVQLWYGDL